MTSDLIKVLIADDHSLVREGLKMILEGQDDIKVIAEAETGLDALNKIIKLEPNVALLDINMPELNGIEVAQDILSHSTQTKIILLTMYSDEAYVLSAIKAGVSGYLLKQSDANTMIDAIRAVNRGEAFFSSSISDSLLKAARIGLKGHRRETSKTDKLSPREKQIIALISDGMGSNDISSKLFISPRTVDKHRQNIMNKLDIHDVANLTRFAINEKITFEKDEATIEETIHFTIKSKIYIYPKSVGRKILSIEGIASLSKYLGYSENEINGFFDIGEIYESISTHPYLKLLGKKEQQEIQKSEKMMSKLHDQIDTMTLGHSSTVKERTFIHKDGHAIKSITNDYFNWKDRIAIQKISFSNPKTSD